MLKRKRESVFRFPNVAVSDDDNTSTFPLPAPTEQGELDMTLMSGDDLSSDEDTDKDEDSADEPADEPADELPDYEQMEEQAEQAGQRGQAGQAGQGERCVCCELAGSEVMRALDAVADRLAGRAGERHIIDAQLGIYNRRMTPLRAEGRPVLPLTRKMLRKHYRTHRVSVMRSVAEEIRVFDLMQRTLRRTMCDVDPDNQKLVSSRNAQLLFRASKAKLDLIKFYTTLEKQRRENEANGSS
jgi:hypothetical protein